MKFNVLSLGLLAMSTLSFAQQPHQAFMDFSYVDAKDWNESGDLFQLNLPVRQGLFVSATRVKVDGEQPDTSFKARGLGGGFYWDTSPNASMYLSYQKIDFDLPNVDEEKLTQYAIGWRSRMTPQFELMIEANQTDFSQESVDETGYKLGLHYYFTPTFAVMAETSRFFDQDLLLIGVRFTSGR